MSCKLLLGRERLRDRRPKKERPPGVRGQIHKRALQASGARSGGSFSLRPVFGAVAKRRALTRRYPTEARDRGPTVDRLHFM